MPYIFLINQAMYHHGAVGLYALGSFHNLPICLKTVSLALAGQQVVPRAYALPRLHKSVQSGKEQRRVTKQNNNMRSALGNDVFLIAGQSNAAITSGEVACFPASVVVSRISRTGTANILEQSLTLPARVRPQVAL